MEQKNKVYLPCCLFVCLLATHTHTHTKNQKENKNIENFRTKKKKKKKNLFQFEPKRDRITDLNSNRIFCGIFKIEFKAFHLKKK